MSDSLTMVFGLGSTGYSCIRRLYGKTALAAVDTRMAEAAERIANLPLIKQQYPDLELHTVASATQILPKVKRMVVSPGLSLNHSLVTHAKSRGIPVVGDLDLFMEARDAPVYGITGTNGKSTTTALLSEMLKERGVAHGGNFGTPALDLLEVPAEHYVLEVSSFQLERWQTGGFDIAVFLNVSEDHIDRHGTFRKYVDCKRRIFSDCGLVICNGDDPYTHPDESVPTIRVNSDLDWRVTDAGAVIDGRFLSSREIALRGSHNRFNLVAAAAVAMHAGATYEEVRKVASSYRGLPHRAQLVAESNGVSYVNDSKATNVGAAIATIEGLSNGRKNIVLIAGGDGKNQSFEALTPTANKYVKKLVAIGRDGPLVAAAVSREAADFAESMGHAITLARDLAQTGDVVLLSPCCASYDMYDGFATRGDEFASQVKEQING